MKSKSSEGKGIKGMTPEIDKLLVKNYKLQEKYMKSLDKKKPSELFEGEGSTLHQSFVEAVERDKNKPNNLPSDVRNKVVKPNKTKELDWRDKIDWVDDWLEIDCQVIFGEKGKKTLIKFIEYLLTQQRTELLEEILREIDKFTEENMTLVFNPKEIPNKAEEAYVQGVQTGFVQGIKNIQKLLNLLNKKDETK